MSVAPSAESPPLQLTNVQDVAIEDGLLTWSQPAGRDSVGAEVVILVLKPSEPQSSGQAFIICCLKETQEHSFELLALAADKIPTALERYLLHELPPHLRQDESNDVQTIVSTKSGLGHALQFWRDVLRPLWGLVRQQLGGKTRIADADESVKDTGKVLITETAQSVRQFARDLRSDGARLAGKSKTIVLLSGDGGIVDLLNGPDETSSGVPTPVMAVLPLGTGNALFHSLHKPLYSDNGPSPMVLALQTLFKGQPTELPVFRASFSSGSKIVSFADKIAADAEGEPQLSQHEAAVSHLNGAIVASYGFHASIVHESDTPEYRVHGDKRFGMVAQELLRESHPYKAQVKVRRPGSQEFEPITRDTHAYVLTTMVSNLERSFTISPASKPLDGRLRLVHFGNVGGERTMDIMMKAYDGGKHVGMAWDDGSAVGYEEVEEIRVVAQEEDARWRKVCVDGTIVEVPQGGQMSVSRLETAPFRFVVAGQVTQI